MRSLIRAANRDKGKDVIFKMLQCHFEGSECHFKGGRGGGRKGEEKGRGGVREGLEILLNTNVKIYQRNVNFGNF